MKQTIRSLLKFFSLTFIVSWILWIASAAVLRGTSPQSAGLQGISGFLYLLGVFAPALVALALTTRSESRAGTLALLNRTLKWSVGVRWYVFAVGYMLAIKLTSALVLRIATGAWPAFGQESIFIMAIATVLSTPVQAGEEIGWRGFALPRLSTLMGLSGASVVLGTIWACWHLPFFFISGSNKTGQSFPLYLGMVVGISIAMAWLYWRTNGSLLLTMLMHAAINNFMDIVPSAVSAATNVFSLSSSLVAWVSVVIMWVCAAYFLVQMRGVKLQDGRERQEPRKDIADLG